MKNMKCAVTRMGKKITEKKQDMDPAYRFDRNYTFKS